jgi:hypothetical protein
MKQRQDYNMSQINRQVRDEVAWKLLRHIKFNCRERVKARLNKTILYRSQDITRTLDIIILQGVFFRIGDKLGGMPIIRNRSLLG